MKKIALVLCAALALVTPMLSLADSHQKLATGEVRKIDKEAGKVTIKHGPLESLDMPAMTMVFRVKDPSLLDRMKVGDKINFAAEKMQGAFTVTKVEPVR